MSVCLCVRFVVLTVMQLRAQVLWVFPSRRRHTTCRSNMRSLLCYNAASQHYIPEDLRPQHGCMLEEIFQIFFPPPDVGSGFISISFISHFILFSCVLYCCYCHTCSNYFCCLFRDSRVRYFRYILLSFSYYFSFCCLFRDSCVRYFRYILLSFSYYFAPIKIDCYSRGRREF
jgi:hypothetical protein